MADRRTRMTPDDRRAQLVALGVAALASHPLEELSIDELCATAGVSRGLLFYYFESKQGFHRAVVSTARDSMLRATEPHHELPPIERLHVTLTSIVRFVREHRETFFSLVRGAASGDVRVREVVEEARAVQTDRVATVLAELGVPESVLLRVALRSWVAFAEQTLVDGALETDMASEEIVAFLERSLGGVASAVDPAIAARIAAAS
jgi:Transcriptional regulator